MEQVHFFPQFGDQLDLSLSLHWHVRMVRHLRLTSNSLGGGDYLEFLMTGQFQTHPTPKMDSMADSLGPDILDVRPDPPDPQIAGARPKTHTITWVNTKT